MYAIKAEALVKTYKEITAVDKLNLEIRLKNDDTSFVNALAAIPGVHSAVLVSYNGDYIG